MTSYEDTSYAVASWQRFETTVTNDLLRALTSAFALIVTADGDLDESEVRRFAALLTGQSLPMARLSPQRVERAFSDATMALLSDPEFCRQRALEVISTAMKSDTDRKIVVAVAEIALNADHRARDGEKKALVDIRSAIGLVA